MAENRQRNILDLDDDCLIEIMSHLSVEDILNLELINSRFGQITPYFYIRHKYWDIDLPIYVDYPQWLLQKIAPYIHSFKLQYGIRTTSYNLGGLLRYFQDVKHAAFVFCRIGSNALVPFLRKNRSSLESLDLIYANDGFQRECYRHISMLSKVTKLTITTDININRFSTIFCEQIKELQLVDYEISSYNLLLLTRPFKRIECLASSEIFINHIPYIVTQIRTLKKMQYNAHLNLRALNDISRIIRILKTNLRNQNRKFTLSLPLNKVHSAFDRKG